MSLVMNLGRGVGSLVLSYLFAFGDLARGLSARGELQGGSNQQFRQKQNYVR